MSIVRGLNGLSFFVLAAFAVSSVQTALAAPTPPPPNPEQLKLDGAIQGLKSEILDFNREALSVENSVLYPAHTRANIYFGMKVDALLIKTISVAIDDLPAQSYTYSDIDARALINSQGLHRVMRMSIEPGAHRISVDYTAQFADAKADDAPISGHYEAIFDKRTREAELELLLSRNSRLSEPQMRLRDRKVAALDEPLPPPIKRKRPRRGRLTLP